MDGMMKSLAGYFRSTHDRVLTSVKVLSEEQLRWQLNPSTPSIAFHVWHLARWADYIQEIINGFGSQLWEQEGLAARWGLGSVSLGFGETGLGLDDDASMKLPLPVNDTLLDYAERSFARANEALDSLDDSQFHQVRPDRYGTYWKEHVLGSAMLNFLTHVNRHLGMIECLRGALGQRGTATR